MKSKNRYLGGAVFFVCAFFLIIGFIIFGKNKEELKINRKYTICYTLGLKGTASITYIRYEYFVNGKRYEDLGITKDRVVTENGRYYIAFLPEDPDISQVLWDIPVPKEVHDIPPGGWDYPPLITYPNMK